MAPTRISHDKLVTYYVHKPPRPELAYGLANGFVSRPERLSTCLTRYYVEKTFLRARREFSNHSQHQVLEIITRGELQFCLSEWLQQTPPNCQRQLWTGLIAGQAVAVMPRKKQWYALQLPTFADLSTNASGSGDRKATQWVQKACSLVAWQRPSPASAQSPPVRDASNALTFAPRAPADARLKANVQYAAHGFGINSQRGNGASVIRSGLSAGTHSYAGRLINRRGVPRRV